MTAHSGNLVVSSLFNEKTVSLIVRPCGNVEVGLIDAFLEGLRYQLFIEMAGEPTATSL